MLAEEWILSRDKKFKYCKGIRIEIYRTLLQMLETYFSDERVVFDMERT